MGKSINQTLFSTLVNHAESDGAVRFGDLYGCNGLDFIFASYHQRLTFEFADSKSKACLIRTIFPVRTSTTQFFQVFRLFWLKTSCNKFDKSQVTYSKVNSRKQKNDISSLMKLCSLCLDQRFSREKLLNNWNFLGKHMALRALSLGL